MKGTATIHRHGDAILLMKLDLPAGATYNWCARVVRGSHAWICTKGEGYITSERSRRHIVAGEMFRTDPGEEFRAESVVDSIIVCICDTSDDDQRFDTIGDRVWPNPLIGTPLEVW